MADGNTGEKQAADQEQFKNQKQATDSASDSLPLHPLNSAQSLSSAQPLVRTGTAAAGHAEDLRDTDTRLLGLWLHGRSRHTQRAYAADARRFLHFAGKPLAQVTLADVQGFADLLGQHELAPTTRARALSSVKSLLAFGHRIGVLPVDVGAALRLPSLRNRLAERILPETDVQKMLALEPGKRNRVLLRLLYAGGLRVSELCDLKWQDLQERGDAGQITAFGKGGKTRAILLSPATWHEIQTLRSLATAPHTPVFASRKKIGHRKQGHLDPAQVLKIVRAAARRAGISLDVSPHWLRHAHASHSLDRGAPIHLVQQTLGHASVATTGRYLHARPTDSSARYLGV
jgi:integrase/recombinase XerD